MFYPELHCSDKHNYMLELSACSTSLRRGIHEKYLHFECTLTPSSVHR